MAFSFANLTRWLVLAGSAVAAVYSAEAQDAGRRPGQAILFSSPDNDSVSSNVLSLAAKPPGLRDFANDEAPALKFDVAPPTAPLPQPQRSDVSPAESQRMQRLLDERKNWALLTPEEILGVPTREKILGIQKRDAFSQPKNETVVEEYYERQERSRARTNNYDYYGMTNGAPHWDFSGSRELRLNPNIWNPAGSKTETPSLMDQFLSRALGHRADSSQASEGGWSKSFNLPAPPPLPTLEQQAAMEQFRQLLQPRSPPGGTAKASSFGNSFFSSQSTGPDSGPKPLEAIPMGASFTPLSSGITMPVGLTPLPSILGQKNTALPTLTPEWKPASPPWMSSAPQLGVMPQRKF